MRADLSAASSADGELDEEHRALRDTVHQFVEREVIPVVGERERADDYPADLLPRLAELGVLGMSIPEEHGGSGLDLVGYALVFEELARGWMGLASVVGSSQSGCWLLSRFGTEEQRRRFLPDLATGRRMSGIALTEPSTGSDLKAITLRADRRGDHLIINGTKTMITQARHADPLVVLAVTDPTATPPHRGMSLLLVEQGTPGWTFGRDITKLGHKGVELCELVFDDAVVPAGNLLGGVEGAGLSQMLAALDRGRIYMAAASVGIARAALETATRYATEREAFGQPIGEHQAIKLKLAGMAIGVRAARLLTHAAAARIDRKGGARSDAAMAKVFASETAIDCSLEAMRILGGYGYTADFPVERLYRDAPLMAIGEGTNEILQLLIADELLAEARRAAG
ncbi:MAG TPA: acyl-CoA dehydrogenase family protein [Acidimicrobiales bacterium]|nr:acyl-CoA dehydrogenase family protein [Acidimicrobiales bacterium]